jgi:hypothetical protein
VEKGSPRTDFEVDSDSLIKEFINHNLLKLYEVNEEDIFLVYTGKQLNAEKSFREELVEDHS